MMVKEILGLVAIAMTFIAFLPYIHSILQGETKPHVFSWVIWGLTTFVIFLAQLSDGGGAGAWAIGVSGLITMYVAILAYQKHADTLITKVDWVFFIAALAAIPLWIITEDPLWTVIILTTIDVFGFAERLRNNVEEMVVHYENKTIQYTVSIGIKALDMTGESSADELLRTVDSFLYKAKEKGRNCVVSIS